MNIDQIIDALKSNEQFMNNITKWETIANKEGIYGDIPDYIDKRLINALNRENIFRLYKHQNEAIGYIIRGNNTVIVTPTASGKTLCYNIPVINSFLKDSTSRAIYLFPTKALSQDQVHELVNINELIGGGLKVYTFDGDTPVNARKAIRNVGNIVVTNPDMLHQGILPNHTKWIKMFSNLKYVVIDEMHQYRGIFGSHVANVIRRLKRIASFYGAKPIFILSSATIRNPRELAENLIEESVAIVAKNCAPSGEKHYILYNPPVINKELGIRSSYIKQTTKIAEEFLRDEIKTIIFVRTRTAVEILTTYLKEKARKLHKNPELVQGYRGGYLPLERRNIEKGLKNNSIKTVISTNALELGIDIGGLDVSITAGYPGTITSFLQQSGRAGRGVTTAISIMVASSAPIDQFMINHPEYFFGNSPELGIINANNLIILINHIKCAAFELPFKDNEIFGVDTTNEILKYLENNGILHHSEGQWYWTESIYPAEEISLRSASTQNFVIIDKTKKPENIIGKMDYFSVPMLLHKDAIYIHRGIQYHVDNLDWERKKAYVKRVDVNYYTDAEMKTTINVLHKDEEHKLGFGFLNYGDISIRSVPTIFKKIKLFTHENIGWGKIELPEIEMDTTAVWFEFYENFKTVQNLTDDEFIGALKGFGNVLKNIAPIHLMCDLHDIGVTTFLRYPITNRPAVFIYDNYPNGIGLSRRFLTLYSDILIEMKELISLCSCKDGCPSCVGPELEVGQNGKKNTLKFLNLILSYEH